jgi:two-component system sensor histidine kinase PilS (NtrC family)
MHELRDWKALRLFNLYRTVLSGLLVTLLILPDVELAEALWAPQLFSAVALLYLVAAVGFSFTIRAREHSRHQQFRLQIIVDIIALSLLGFASGRPVEIFGSLLLIPVAFAGFWQPGRMAQFYTALALLGLLASTLAHQWLGHRDYPVAGFGALASVLLSITLLSGLIGRRSAATQAVASERARHLASLTELNAYIVQRMEEGVIVVDADDQVRLLNPVAAELFKPQSAYELPYPLEQLSPALARALRDWRAGHPVESDILAPLHVQMTAPEPARDQHALLLLEDTRERNSRLQREKLAALGRLTASLAHEIRNPLGAISQSVQLLEESSVVDAQDRRLLEIIANQSKRLNRLVEDILHLSRRKVSHWQDLTLESWLRELLEEWRLGWPEAYRYLHLQVQPDVLPPAQVCVDPQHLRQVLTILVENALLHGRPPEGEPELVLKLIRSGATATPCIELCDNGPGIAPELQNQIFEPFFSTSSGGTGLGLYLAQELCAANYAELSYSGEGSGSCFQIRFPMERPVHDDSDE